MWTIQSWYQDAYNAAKAEAGFIRDKADHYLNTYLANMPGETRESIGRLLADTYRKRLAAVPDLAVYPELRGMPEFLEAAWRGAQAGAEMDDAQAAANVMTLWLLHREFYNKLTPEPAHCSSVYFHTSDHGALMGVNLDTTPDEPYLPPQWPLTNEHLVIGGVSSGVFLDEISPEIFPAPVFAILERYCRSAEEAVEVLSRYNHFWGPGNLIVADRKGHVAMIEKSACRMGVRWSHDGFGYVTAMTAEDPAMHAYLEDRREASLKARGLTAPCADTRYWAVQETRRGIMNRLMKEARANPTFEKMQQIMQYRGEDGLCCDNGDVLYPGDPPLEYTIKTQIICLSEGRAAWWTRVDETNTPSWEHREEDVHFKDVLLWP